MTESFILLEIPHSNPISNPIKMISSNEIILQMGNSILRSAGSTADVASGSTTDPIKSTSFPIGSDLILLNNEMIQIQSRITMKPISVSKKNE